MTRVRLTLEIEDRTEAIESLKSRGYEKLVLPEEPGLEGEISLMCESREKALEIAEFIFDEPLRPDEEVYYLTEVEDS